MPCTSSLWAQQQDMFLGAGGPMEAETMSLPPMKEYSRRLGVPGLVFDRSRVPFVAAAIRVLFTCRHASAIEHSSQSTCTVLHRV